MAPRFGLRTAREASSEGTFNYPTSLVYNIGLLVSSYNCPCSHLPFEVIPKAQIFQRQAHGIVDIVLPAALGIDVMETISVPVSFSEILCLAQHARQISLQLVIPHLRRHLHRGQSNRYADQTRLPRTRSFSGPVHASVP